MNTETALHLMHQAVKFVQKNNKVDLSIVIVSWNVKELLIKLLQSIFIYTKGINYEIIVVDNHSKDGTVEELEKKYREEINEKKLKIIANNYNAGFAQANNHGLKQAKGEYVLFMNPDMEIKENSFKKLLELLQQKTEIDVCTCRLLYPDKTVQPNVKSFPTLCDQVLILLKLHHFLSFLPCLKKFLRKDFDYKQQAEAEQIMGAFIFTKREIMNLIGGWNEDYWLWWEDVELCKTLKKKGYNIVYTPITEVMHYEGKSFEQTFGLKKQKRFNKGMLLFFKKHHPKWQYYILLSLQPISYGLTWLTQLFKIKQRPQSRV